MKTPKGAREVFSGKIFKVYQWDQEMFDGTTAVFERATKQGSVIVVPVVGQEIRMQYEEQPGHDRFLSLPAGRIEWDEPSPLAAAKRELAEETGLVSDDWELWIEREICGIDWPIYVYIARACRQEAVPNPDQGGEIITPHMVNFDGLLDSALDPLFRNNECAFEFLKMKLDPEYKQKFRQLLFKNE